MTRAGTLLLMAAGVAACADTPVAPPAGNDRPSADVATPTQAEWYIRNDNGGATVVPFGLATDTPLQRDYDGDGKADIAVFRPETSTWYVLNSSTAAITQFQFGTTGDIPLPADYDGDGKADFAVFRPSTGQWWFRYAVNGSVSVFNFGNATDIPVPADYDGDGKTDVAIFRPGTVQWWIVRSSNGSTSTTPFGLATDTPVPADYDGDGKADIAMFRASTNQWWINRSSGGSTNTTWGASGDVPVAADYDADGKADLAVFRPSTQQWWISQSSDGAASAITFGIATDIPVPARWTGTFLNKIAVFRGAAAPPPPPQPQAITFTSTAPAVAPVGATYAVSATGGASGNPVTFSSLTPATCGVAGSTVSFSAIGTCTIAANQAGNASFLDAPQVTQQVMVTYAFSFRAPILEAPAVNPRPRNGVVSIAFTLGQAASAAALASGTPRMSRVACTAPFAPQGVLRRASLTGRGVTYNPLTRTFTLSWEVEKGDWRNTCRQLVIELSDGTQHRAIFAF